ncbi:MAG TPA: hypothetical protein VJ386_09580, partial [Candidatus Deferrimicrobiaceae bacterium]|nr:hypothetical protein [Candidatus Deferrimicrobiaceae bacterium]
YFKSFLSIRDPAPVEQGDRRGRHPPVARLLLTGIASVPCRYIHSPFSTCLLTGFDHTWRLLAAFRKSAPGV